MSIEQDFNNILWLKINSPLTYMVTIIELYGDQCETLQAPAKDRT